MKKYVILILVIIVCGLGFSYRKHLLEQRGKLLVADAYDGHLVGVKNDVEEGAPLGYVLTFSDEEREYTDQQFNALHAAASGGNEDVILYLLEQGLPIDAITPQGWTPLFIAARDGRSEAVKLLLFKGAAVNVQTDRGATALTMVLTQHYPSEKERLDVLEYLLRRGSNPNLADRYGHTALFYAAAQENLPAMKALVEYGAQTDEAALKPVFELVAPRTSPAAREIAEYLQQLKAEQGNPLAENK